MASVGILKCVLKSAQGNLQQTVDSIKNEEIKISSKNIPSIMETLQTPYYLLEEEVKDNQQDIYKNLRKIVSELILDLDERQRESTALIIGTSIVDWNIIDAINDTLSNNNKKEYEPKKSSIDSYAKELSQEFNLNGFTMTINTACTSSANAMLEAYNLINADIFKNVIVLGMEIFSEIMSRGFSAMQLLSLTKQKPFDKECDGMVLGEGIAGVLLSKESSIWSLEGGANCSNSYNITAASESGDEFVEVMQLALENTKLDINDIKGLKAHATSTPANDIAEKNAIRKLFKKDIHISCLKPFVGHTLGACGVLELALFMACIDDGVILETVDGTFMCNYFGFGGNNTSLIIKKELS